MKNLDTLQQEKATIMQELSQAIKDGDEKAYAQAFDKFTQNLQDMVMHEARTMSEKIDQSVLAGRGVRQLTSEETDYYQQVIGAMKTGNPKQALTELTVVMPKTVIDAVFEDLVQEHPLLNAINFKDTSGLIEYLVNTSGKQLATWGKLTAEIVKELTGGFKLVNLSLMKLSAFLPVAKSMLDLGPKWLDRYVRALLGEAAAYGLEEGIVNGTGKDMPIGANRQVGEGVTVTDGVYPLKAAVKLNDLGPVALGSLLAGMAVDPNGNTRVVKDVIMIVNPVDYLKKIMPATTVRGADGKYVNDVFPFPIKPIQSTQVEEGKAIIGLPKRYFMGIGTTKSGKIEYSDEYKFLEDERVYLVKLYGHGEPLDNTAFAYVDISDMKPAMHQVYVMNDVGSPVPMIPLDARLYSLAIGSLTLSPSFDKDKYSYTASTTNATNAITVVPKDAESTVEIDVDGTTVANGDSATWAEGENTVNITVINGAASAMYTVIVTKS